MINLIDYIARNVFLKKIFPGGFGSEILIGQINMDLTGRIELCLHIKTKPSSEIEKWGVWGVNYNTIVVRILGELGEEFYLKNFKNFKPEKLKIEKANDFIGFSYMSESWGIEFKVKNLVFQECSTYFDDP